MTKKILVAVDGSAESEKATRYAAEHAKKYNTELTILHVIERDPSYRETSPETKNSLRKRANAFAEPMKNLAKKIGAKTDIIILAGIKPSAEIIRFAEKENYGLIVIGCRGKSVIKRLTLGSVSAEVIRYSHCPVTVVR